jgi:catechol 2,3-dioxygenase-like lactoylglutathione lyase family enzyme
VNVSSGITFLPTQDLEATDHFYREVCGLRLVLDQGACRIYEVTPGSYWGFCTHKEKLLQAESVMLTLVTDEVDQFYEHLQRYGVSTDRSPRHNFKFGIYHFFATDPNGYQLEVQRFDDVNWNRWV